MRAVWGIISTTEILWKAGVLSPAITRGGNYLDLFLEGVAREGEVVALFARVWAGLDTKNARAGMRVICAQVCGRAEYMVDND